MRKRPKIDKIDIIILKILLKDARTPYADISKDCGITSNSVKLRINRLKKEGVITGEITQVNPKSLGYNYIAFMPIKASANKIQSVYEYLKKTPKAINVIRETSRNNITVMVALKKIENIDEVLGFIKKNPDILNANAHIAWDVVMVDHPENLEIEEQEGK